MCVASASSICYLTVLASHPLFFNFDSSFVSRTTTDCFELRLAFQSLKLYVTFLILYTATYSIIWCPLVVPIRTHSQTEMAVTKRLDPQSERRRHLGLEVHPSNPNLSWDRPRHSLGWDPSNSKRSGDNPNVLVPMTSQSESPATTS